MNEVLYGHYMLIDIIVHDSLVICMSRVVHIAFIIYVVWYSMQQRIALHLCTGTSHDMGVSAWYGSTLRLVFDGGLGTVGRVSNKVARWHT